MTRKRSTRHQPSGFALALTISTLLLIGVFLAQSALHIDKEGLLKPALARIQTLALAPGTSISADHASAGNSDAGPAAPHHTQEESQ